MSTDKSPLIANTAPLSEGRKRQDEQAAVTTETTSACCFLLAQRGTLPLRCKRKKQNTGVYRALIVTEEQQLVFHPLKYLTLKYLTFKVQ